MPLVVPQEFLDLYPLESIEPPKLLPENGHVRHPWVQRMVEFWDHDAELGSPERRAQARACYFGLVTFMDRQLGAIMAALDETGLADSTVIVYTSDHGDNLGTRAMWNKSTLYREAVGIPLIMAGPGIPAGRVRTTCTSLVDIYPTALDVAGVASVPEESNQPGQSLVALALGDDRPERIVLSEYHAVGAETSAFMLADARFKYHHYVGFEPELFDLTADPEETCNLASDPAYAQECRRFEAHLHGLLDPLEVDARARREQNNLIARFGGREAALKWGNPGPTPAPESTAQQPTGAQA